MIDAEDDLSGGIDEGTQEHTNGSRQVHGSMRRSIANSGMVPCVNLKLHQKHVKGTVTARNLDDFGRKISSKQIIDMT